MGIRSPNLLCQTPSRATGPRARFDEDDPFGRLAPAPLPDPRADPEPDRIDAPVGRNATNRRLDVAKVETLLAKRGYLDLKPTDGATGYFGGRALEAVEKFQRDSGLAVDGRLDPDGPTLTALRAPVAGNPAKALAAPASPQGAKTGVQKTAAAAPALLLGLPLLGAAAAEAGKRAQQWWDRPANDDGRQGDATSAANPRLPGGKTPPLPGYAPAPDHGPDILADPPAGKKQPDPGLVPPTIPKNWPGFTPEQRKAIVEVFPDEARALLAAIILESRGTPKTQRQVDFGIKTIYDWLKEESFEGVKHTGGGHHPDSGRYRKEQVVKRPGERGLTGSARPDGTLRAQLDRQEFVIDLQHQDVLIDGVTPSKREREARDRLIRNRTIDEALHALVEIGKQKTLSEEEWQGYAERMIRQPLSDLFEPYRKTPRGDGDKHE